MLRLDEMKALLDQIIEAIHERAQYFEDDPARPVPGAPANPAELQALEKHFGFKLPPSYRQALCVYNGIRLFYFDVPLLSAKEIIEDTNEAALFEEPFPELWRYIFACGTESYDAFCFDPRRTDSQGEMEIVRLADTGEEERWPGFEAFLMGYLESLRKEIENERRDREELSED